MTTKKTPANRMAIKLLPKTDIIAAKKANVSGGFKSHNWVYGRKPSAHDWPKRIKVLSSRSI